MLWTAMLPGSRQPASLITLPLQNQHKVSSQLQTLRLLIVSLTTYSVGSHVHSLTHPVPFRPQRHRHRGECSWVTAGLWELEGFLPKNFRLSASIRVFDSKAGTRRIGSLCCLSFSSVLGTRRRVSSSSVWYSALTSGTKSLISANIKRYLLFSELRLYTYCEYTGLFVKSQFDNDTASVFKRFKGSGGAFSECSMNNLHRSAGITVAASRIRGRSNFQKGRGRGHGRP